MAKSKSKLQPKLEPLPSVLPLGHNWVEQTHEEFRWAINCLPPLIRLGYCDEGAFLGSEPHDLRPCNISGKQDYSYSANFALEGRYFCTETLTLHEFKALCDRVMPGASVCSGEYGREYVDANGDLRADLQFPIRKY